jgi:hypothetical protein
LWEERRQPGLADEEAEESRRRRVHELARRCGPFLRRFFSAWDSAPGRATLRDHVNRLRQLGDDLGILGAGEDDPLDRLELSRLWEGVEAWLARHAEAAVDARMFQRRLAALAGAGGLPRTPRGPGRVRVLSATSARHLDAACVFVMGLGERGFPRLETGPSILEDDREADQRGGGSTFLAAPTRYRARCCCSTRSPPRRGACSC